VRRTLKQHSATLETKVAQKLSTRPPSDYGMAMLNTLTKSRSCAPSWNKNGSNVVGTSTSRMQSVTSSLRSTRAKKAKRRETSSSTLRTNTTTFRRRTKNRLPSSATRTRMLSSHLKLQPLLRKCLKEKSASPFSNVSPRSSRSPNALESMSQSMRTSMRMRRSRCTAVRPFKLLSTICKRLRARSFRPRRKTRTKTLKSR
jgi:hypothetical protein